MRLAYRCAQGFLLFLVLLVTLIAMVGVQSTLALAQGTTADLTQLSLEELMQIEVTSVAKQEQRQFDAPAAVSVVTQEDIRRSGATSIPEALRMVPGVQVARVNANTWAISIRGFNNQFANKLLVLIDGRTVYTPTFAGVYWDVQDVLLEDIDRIEVIRGPGGTLWGANAVNGIINIITKNAKDSQGILITGGGGTEERGFGSVRYGGKLGDDLFYRVYAKYFDRNPFVATFGNDAHDGWDAFRGGFRLDWTPSEWDSLMVQGDIYDGRYESLITAASLLPPFQRVIKQHNHRAGGDILARWNRLLSERSSWQLQVYYDRTTREDFVRQDVDTFDVDFQHGFAFGQRHRLLWGLEYRVTRTHFTRDFFMSVSPATRTDQLVSGFVQDEITLMENRLRLTLGTKLEHNDYSGLEIQPSGRLLWTPHQRHSVWVAVSRAVRVPSRVENDVRLNLTVVPDEDGLLNLVSVFGSRHLTAENLLAFELGYRVQPSDRFFLDLATFYHTYGTLISAILESPFFESSPPPPHLVIPVQFINKGNAETYGVEVAAHWTVTDQLRLSAGYTWLKMQVRGANFPLFLPGSNPRNQFHLRSYLNLPWNFEFDTMLYYVDHLPDEIPSVPSYFRLDLRLGWWVTDRLDLSLVGQNVSQATHREFGGPAGGLLPSEVPRGMYGKLTWRF